MTFLSHHHLPDTILSTFVLVRGIFTVLFHVLVTSPFVTTAPVTFVYRFTVILLAHFYEPLFACFSVTFLNFASAVLPVPHPLSLPLPATSIFCY